MSTRNGLKCETVEKVKDFYYKTEISWQVPDRKNPIIIPELTDTGEKVKRIEQIQYLLMSMKVAHHIYLRENEAKPIGLSKFRELCPANIKVFDKIPRNVCVCLCHKNGLSFAPRTRDAYQFIS